MHLAELLDLANLLHTYVKHCKDRGDAGGAELAHVVWHRVTKEAKKLERQSQKCEKISDNE